MALYENSVFHIIVACIIPNIGGFVGSIFTSTDSSSWYVTLDKPNFTPPSWVFIPAWTILYLLMGYSSYRIWRIGNGCKGEAKIPLLIYVFQLILNWLWTPIFFAQALGWSFVEMIVLAIAVVATTALFFKIDKVAGIILIPYIAWISFAATLNYSIWYLN
ncbi:hypothetical protein PVAND_008209 [Polypedilum vanderplanki]|uniref:Translocator protein n=1 Tax=Polypedilum vanderplanki TaxID=319348 RepID=A0A9J6CAA3_POLVA|nr:hypothetical protein PVAND_008209 [Polypedilum vanderplanki]